MKYEVIDRGDTVEAITAYSGYRVRMTLQGGGSALQVRVHVRGSESEDEVEVGVPQRSLSSAAQAFDHGYECALLWIDAENRRILSP